MSGKIQTDRLWIIGSVLLHMVGVVGLLWITAIHPEPMRLPGTARGSHVVLVYSSHRGQIADEISSATRPRPQKKKQLAAIKLPVRNTPTQTPEPPHPTPPSDSTPDVAPGQDALGNGDIDIALMQFFPTPKPDLTKLPTGTSGEVVLDIVIDAAGKIVEIKKTKGVGFGVDETVMATVQTWTFQPATRNGQPVPSEQELHFHYERS
jgi:periplasmic protein TonB